MTPRGTGKKLFGATAALSAVALIGWVDLRTGPDLGFSLFYLVPIVACGWLYGHRVAAIVATASGIAWFLADWAFRPEEALPVTLWNATTRLLIYGGVGWLTARVHADRRRLTVANERLRDLLDVQSTAARTDPLTGLPNWRGLKEHLERDMERARRDGEGLALLYLDLDGFKGVNDRYGHAAGDELLRDVAKAIRSVTRASDVAARVGGDELVVVMPGAGAEAAGRAGERLLETIATIGARHAEAPVGVSVGIACFSDVPDDVDTLVRAADSAMYEAKRAGKGRVVMARPERAGAISAQG